MEQNSPFLIEKMCIRDRYNIGPIEHDPFILISYLSAKYEEFTFEQVKPELDALFALQYRLETEAVNETVTELSLIHISAAGGRDRQGEPGAAVLPHAGQNKAHYRPEAGRRL